MLRWKVDVAIVAAALLVGQIGVFYLSALRCALQSTRAAGQSDGLRALVVSDVHLLGKRRRTAVERLWIDMQISNALSAAVRVHRPEVVLVLGDQLDEGGYPTPASDWEEYIERFRAAFHAATGIKTVFLLGNHDAAFGRHLNSAVISRHERAFGPSNHVTTIHGHKIVQLNTMALDTDISNVEVRAQASSFLRTLELDADRDRHETPHSTILLTHFPLHREDDLECGDERVREGGHITYEHPSFKYEVHHHVLSRELSKELLEKVRPSIVLSGHTHAWCAYKHGPNGPREYTIPAFSWGQRPDPSYALVDTDGNGNVTMSHCALPSEPRIFALYATAAVAVAARGLWRCLVASRSSRGPRHEKKLA